MRETETSHGHLKPTAESLAAWKRTVEICKILGSKICLVQCPPSLACNEKNVTNMEKFFGQISREGLKIAWEPRHRSWYDNPNTVKKLCTELSLIHAVDIFKRQPQLTGDVSYIRLPGLSGELSYKYSYVDSDLKILADKIAQLDAKETYVLFNNVTMAKDCLRFKELLS